MYCMTHIQNHIQPYLLAYLEELRVTHAYSEPAIYKREMYP